VEEVKVAMEFSLLVDKYSVEHMDAHIVLVEKYD